MSTTTTNAAQPDLAAVKQRQQQTWSSADYAAVAARIVPMAEVLAQNAGLRAGDRVLDVATGSGNAALAAARCGCEATGVDYVPALLERARARAAAEGLEIEFAEGDAENLAFPDASFDAVLSCLGVMFTPDQERAAAELVRVCKPGGTSAWSTGRRRASSASCSAPSASTSRRRPGSGRRPSGGPRSASGSSSATRCRGSTSSGAPSCSGSAPPTTSRASSVTTTARSTRPSGPWTSRAGSASTTT